MRRLLVLLFLASACSDGNGDRCVTDSDCFFGEVCQAGFCGEPQPTVKIDVGSPNAGTTTGDAGGVEDVDPNPDPLPDMSTGGGDIGTATDVGTPDMSDDAATPAGCIVDPFTSMCPSDDNDDFADYITVGPGRGCLGAGDDFEGGEAEVTDHVMCPLETRDRFSTNLLPCDSTNFIVEVTVTPDTVCDPDDWDLAMRIQGNDCSSALVDCRTLPDGSKQAIGIVEPSISIASPYIEITRLGDNVQFGYDLQIVVRE